MLGFLPAPEHGNTSSPCIKGWTESLLNYWIQYKILCLVFTWLHSLLFVFKILVWLPQNRDIEIHSSSLSPCLHLYSNFSVTTKNSFFPPFFSTPPMTPYTSILLCYLFICLFHWSHSYIKISLSFYFSLSVYYIFIQFWIFKLYYLNMPFNSNNNTKWFHILLYALMYL